MPYRALLIAKKPIVIMSWVGLANAATWAGLGARALEAPAAVSQSASSAAATARAVDQLDARVDQLRHDNQNTRETVAALGERVGGVIVRIDTLYDTMIEMKGEARDEAMEQRRLLTTVILSAFGFFITVSGALIATLWSIRKGWLRTSEWRE